MNLKVTDVGVALSIYYLSSCRCVYVLESTPFTHPFFFTLPPLIKMKRGIRSVWGRSVGGEAKGRNDRNVKTLSNTVITKMSHQSPHLPLTVTFSPPSSDITHDIRERKMEPSFQHCHKYWLVTLLLHNLIRIEGRFEENRLTVSS